MRPLLDGSTLGGPRVNGVLPRTVGSWLTYALCSSVFATGVIDQAFGGMMLFLFLGIPLVGLTFLVQLVNLPSRWHTSRGGASFPCWPA